MVFSQITSSCNLIKPEVNQWVCLLHESSAAGSDVPDAVGLSWQ